MIRIQLQDIIRRAIKKAGYEVPADIVIIESQNKLFGDYSSPVLFKIKGSPKEVSQKIIEQLSDPIIEKAEEKKRFINLFLSKQSLATSLKEIIKKDDKYGKNDVGEGKSANVEFISANPTGPLHLGNARGGPLGDVLANILQKSSYKVEREFYVNDIGAQIEHFGETLKYWQGKEAGKNAQFPENGYKGDYIKELADKINENNDLILLAKSGIEMMVDEMKATIEKMGIEFDKYVFESNILKSGKTERAVKELEKNEQTQEKDGALWLRGKNNQSLKDRECVLRRSDKNKTPTYFANDIAYHKDKFDRRYDLMIDVWGANHHGHIARMKTALNALGLDEKKLNIVLYQYVRLKNAGKIEKMAKREGTYITAKQVLDEVGKDVFRMMMLLSAPNTHLDFDFEIAKEKSKKNPVFYVQYAHARICGILRKTSTTNYQLPTTSFNEYESALIKELIKLPDLIIDIGRNFEVHHLPHFAITLAKKFHQFYKNCPVIKAKNEDEKQSRIALIKAAQIVLKNTLTLMGIEAPKKM